MNAASADVGVDSPYRRLERFVARSERPPTKGCGGGRVFEGPDAALQSARAVLADFRTLSSIVFIESIYVLYTWADGAFYWVFA